MDVAASKESLLYTSDDAEKLGFRIQGVGLNLVLPNDLLRLHDLSLNQKYAIILTFECEDS